MQDFRKLDVWDKAHQLTLEIYRTSGAFPASELYGLSSQIRRAAVSIGANICEGCGRASDVDFARFLQHSFSSACELEYHLILAMDLGCLSKENHSRLHDDLQGIKRMLSSLIKRLKADSRQPTAPTP